MVYFVTVAHLNPLQLVLVGTSMELSIFVFEIPTGVVADTISRRLSVIIGVFIIGVGTFLMGFIPQFLPILVAQIDLGFGLHLHQRRAGCLDQR